MQRELNDTKHQLELYKTIDVAVKGSLEEVTHRLHQIGDYSQVNFRWILELLPKDLVELYSYNKVQS